MKYIISSTAWWPNMAFFSGPYFFPFFSIWIFFHEHSDWLWENTDQKKLRIWALFIPCSHKKKVTNTYNVRNCKTYISRNKSNCPLDNKCLTDKLSIKLTWKPTMESMSYPQKFILVSAWHNLSLGTTTIQCNLETGQTKMISNFRNMLGVQNIKIRTLILNRLFLKNLLNIVSYQNRVIFASWKS